jgi:hypothetical protein
MLFVEITPNTCVSIWIVFFIYRKDLTARRFRNRTKLLMAPPSKSEKYAGTPLLLIDNCDMRKSPKRVATKRCVKFKNSVCHFFK